MIKIIKNISVRSGILNLSCRMHRRLPSAGFTGALISGSVWMRDGKQEKNGGTCVKDL
jgi:hypothetical protein